MQGGELREQEQKEALLVAEVQCFKKMNSDPVNLTGLFCERQFDNILCWPDSEAGQVHEQHCPSYINRFDTSKLAYKRCLENGSWYISPETNDTWTDYSQCIIQHKTVSLLLQENIPRVKVLYIIGYSLSLATLILAVFIMLYFRRLRCPRNLIHVNLFLVYLFRAFISLLKEILLVGDIGFPNDVIQREDGAYEFSTGLHVGCKTFFTLLNYMILTSIIWILIEGLYLQLLLSLSVSVKKLKLRWFILLGWGLPVIFAVAWGVARYYYDDSYCWNVAHYHKNLYWIIRGPIVIAVIVTFLIFVNILRSLFTKLTAVNCPSSRKYRYRRLAKSTIILVPLFAVYYMGFIWLPDDLDPMSQLIELYIEMLFNSFQGFLVALLFCFLNAEVQNEIKKKWYRHVLKRSGSFGNHRNSRRFRYSDADSIASSNYPQPTKKKKNKLLERVKEENAPLNKRHENGLQDHNDNIHPDFHSDFHSDFATSDVIHYDFHSDNHTDIHSDNSASDHQRDSKVTQGGSNIDNGQNDSNVVHDDKVVNNVAQSDSNVTQNNSNIVYSDTNAVPSYSIVNQNDSNVVHNDSNAFHNDSNVVHENTVVNNVAQSDLIVNQNDSNVVYSDPNAVPSYSNVNQNDSNVVHSDSNAFHSDSNGHCNISSDLNLPRYTDVVPDSNDSNVVPNYSNVVHSDPNSVYSHSKNVAYSNSVNSDKTDPQSDQNKTRSDSKGFQISNVERIDT